MLRQISLLRISMSSQSALMPSPKSCFFSPPQGHIAVYQHMLEYCLRFPLDPFIMRMLSAYNICLAQLSAKSIRHVIGQLWVCHFKGWSPFWDSFHKMHILKPLRVDHTEKGWWTIVNCPSYLTVYPPAKTLKNWRDSWYYVIAPTSPGHPYRFTAPLRFRLPKPNMSQLPDISSVPMTRRS